MSVYQSIRVRVRVAVRYRVSDNDRVVLRFKVSLSFRGIVRPDLG